MAHLSPQVCLTWAIMSVLVSDSSLCGDWILLRSRLIIEDCSSVRFVSGISGIVKSSVALSECYT